MKRILTLALVLISVNLSYAGIFGPKVIKGDGTRTTEKRTIESFEQLSVEGNFDVELVDNNTHEAKIRCEANLSEYISLEIKGTRLTVSAKKGYELKPSKDRKINIQLPASMLSSVKLDGSGRIINASKLTGKSISIKLEGSGTIKLKAEAPKMSAQLDGSGKIVLEGEADNFSCNKSGSGEILADNLEAANVSVKSAGSGSVHVQCSKKLSVTSSGSGNTYCTGNPKKISSKVSGSGIVIQE